MKPLCSALTIMTLAVCGALIHPGAVPAQTNGDYTYTPPFINTVAAPNILIIMDNSGSMENRACESTSCGIKPDGTVSTSTSFDATTRYNGFADPMRCYTWDTTDKRFESLSAPSSPVNTVKTTLNQICGTGEWDGNFVNWATFRRFDAVKKAMSGGNCWNPTVAAPASPRNGDGTCKPYGTPSLKTVRVQNTGTSTETTPSVPKTGGANVSYIGRVPSSVYSATNPAQIYVQIQSTGDLCIDDDNSGGCPDSGGFTETLITGIAFAMPGEPTGVIQQVGAKARLGLAVFNGGSSDDGLKVLTPIGSFQSVDFSGTFVESFTTNTAAMIDSVDEAFPATWTPLAETLYDAVRYVAQINSAYYGGPVPAGQYVYPIAFSDVRSKGVNYQSNGIGSLGAGNASLSPPSKAEEKALTGSETCPAGYITNACGRDPFFFGSNHTPPWASPSQQVNCCKTFIVIFTDGEPTQDENIPGTLQDKAHSYHGVHCTGSDAAAPPRPVNSTCNNNPNTPFSELLGEHKTDYADNGSGYLDSVAYWAHVNDLRPCTTVTPPAVPADDNIDTIGVLGHCLDGMQNVTVYTFFAFGNINGRGLLAQTARLGGFDDANGNKIPEAGEWDKENNYTGVATPDGIPDAYFESSNVDDLQDKLMATISSIIRRSSSGAAVSVLATSSTGEGSLYQAYFYPSTQESETNNDVKWIGYTQSLWVDTFGNLREDTNGDGRQDYKTDYIVRTSLGAGNIVVVDKFKDTLGTGLANPSTCIECGKGLSDIKPIWEAGKRLALKKANTRTILTWVDNSPRNGVVDAGEVIPFTTANSGTLAPYLRASAATTPYTPDAIINFIRGCEIADCADQAPLRDRRLQVPSGSLSLNVWKLGDVIDAPPTVVAAPRDRYDIIQGDPSYTAFFTKYRTRRQMVYVGANDGMLHAFNGGYYHPGDDTSASAPSGVTEHGWFTTSPAANNPGDTPLGEEMWGFIPYQLLPHLQWLARTDYQHVYYVDLPPVVKDVRIFPNDADHPGGWGTVLIGGFRLGGSCGACTAGSGGPKMTVNIGGTNVDFFSAYFALDVTNPEVQPKLLWSFSRSDLGLTTSVPTVVRVNAAAFHADNSVAKWFMVVGSGATTYDGKSTQLSKLFVVDMANGSLATTSPMNVGSANALIGDMKSFDRDLDYRSDVVYFGQTIDDGAPWNGKVLRLTLGQTLPFGFAGDPNTWGQASASAPAGSRMPTEMLNTFAVDTTPATTVSMGPVLAAPATAIDDASKLWVFVGSGRYFGPADKTDMSPQYVVGLKDSVINGTCAQSGATSCLENDLLDVTAVTVCVVGIGNCGQSGGTDQVSGISGVTTMPQLIQKVAEKKGWVLRLMPTPTSATGVGERVLTAATVFGGIVFFPSYTPTNDYCAATGTSALYGLFYQTGGPYSEPIIGTTAGASGGVQNVNKSTGLGGGMAFGAVPYVGSGSDGTSPYKLFINTSSGSLSPQEVNLAIDPRAHFASWMNM